MTARLYNIYSMDEEVRIRAALENSLGGGGSVASRGGPYASFKQLLRVYYFSVSD